MHGQNHIKFKISGFSVTNLGRRSMQLLDGLTDNKKYRNFKDEGLEGKTL
jgi:hypothetical protein